MGLQWFKFTLFFKSSVTIFTCAFFIPSSHHLSCLKLRSFDSSNYKNSLLQFFCGRYVDTPKEKVRTCFFFFFDWLQGVFGSLGGPHMGSCLRVCMQVNPTFVSRKKKKALMELWVNGVFNVIVSLNHADAFSWTNNRWVTRSLPNAFQGM